MGIRKFFIAAAVVAVTAACSSREPVRVACVGDSITYGHGIADREHDTYPALLDSLLGDGYDVRNFGISGRILLSNGDEPYTKEQIYRDALDFMPEIVTIALGTNDSKPQNWIYENEFKSDLKRLVASFRELPSNPEVWLCLPTPAWSNAWDINDSIICNGVIPYIREVAEEEGLGVIDLRTALIGCRNYFPDTIHPNEEGHKAIADIIYNALNKKN